MPSLRDLQRTFVDSLFASTHCDAILAQTGMNVSARLGIHRNNVFSNYREALRAVYPVIERLVGSEFFRHVADRFIATHGSASGDLHRFGEGFGDFLLGLPGAEHLVYLGDTGYLEWLIHESFHAADHAPLPPQRLAGIEPERYGALRFEMHPTCRLFASPYPMHRIWRSNQPNAGDDDSIDLASGGVTLLVRRCDFSVALEPLARNEFALLSLIAAGQCLGPACDHMLQSDPAFDVAAFSQRHIGGGTLVDFSDIGCYVEPSFQRKLEPSPYSTRFQRFQSSANHDVIL